MKKKSSSSETLSFHTKEPCMNSSLLLEQQKNILERLSMLPRKILSLHGHDHVAEMVLYELCNENCFNIDKAAYFIDNPDFDYLKGIAGHCRSEIMPPDTDIWQGPKELTESAFSKKVRTLMHESSYKRKKNEQDTVGHIAQELDLSCHGFYAWPMKHDNHGIFIYERSHAGDENAQAQDKFLPEGVVLLSFCPVRYV
jgi:hypothetical protein